MLTEPVTPCESQTPKALKTTQAFVSALGCRQNLMVRPCRWRHNTLVIGHKEINLKLNWEIPSWWLASTLLEGSMKAAEGERSLTILSSDGPRVLKYWLTRQGVATCIMVTQLLWRWATAFRLNLRDSHLVLQIWSEVHDWGGHDP